jgi:2-hydroxychromene-2-carboxylate isomerase
LSLLRLALACSHAGETPHAVVETVFHHVWRGGGVADDAARGQALTAHLAPPMGPDAPEVKQQLKANTDEAIARGVFGVPSLCVDDKVFWGLDALPMLQAYLAGDPWFDQAWDAAAAIAPGVRR